MVLLIDSFYRGMQPFRSNVPCNILRGESAYFVSSEFCSPETVDWCSCNFSNTFCPLQVLAPVAGSNARALCAKAPVVPNRSQPVCSSFSPAYLLEQSDLHPPATAQADDVSAADGSALVVVAVPPSTACAAVHLSTLSRCPSPAALAAALPPSSETSFPLSRGNACSTPPSTGRLLMVDWTPPASRAPETKGEQLLFSSLPKKKKYKRQDKTPSSPAFIVTASVEEEQMQTSPAGHQGFRKAATSVAQGSPSRQRRSQASASPQTSGKPACSQTARESSFFDSPSRAADSSVAIASPEEQLHPVNDQSGVKTESLHPVAGQSVFSLSSGNFGYPTGLVVGEDNYSHAPSLRDAGSCLLQYLDGLLQSQTRTASPNSRCLSSPSWHEMRKSHTSHPPGLSSVAPLIDFSCPVSSRANAVLSHQVMQMRSPAAKSGRVACSPDMTGSSITHVADLQPPAAPESQNTSNSRGLHKSHIEEYRGAHTMAKESMQQQQQQNHSSDTASASLSAPVEGRSTTVRQSAHSDLVRNVKVETPPKVDEVKTLVFLLLRPRTLRPFQLHAVLSKAIIDDESMRWHHNEAWLKQQQQLVVPLHIIQESVYTGTQNLQRQGTAAADKVRAEIQKELWSSRQQTNR